LRKWSIEVCLVNEKGEDVAADIFSRVTYNLHESFGARARQSLSEPPFRVQEEGWGEFDMQITLMTKEKGGEHHILHDLNFQKEIYDHKETITFKNPKPGLIELLRDSGPVPGDENGRKKEDLLKRKKGGKKGVNMDELAENLQKLNEDDLLQVVQMIHDGKSTESYTKNDVDAGEFHVDLYTLPDDLIQSLWTFTESKV